MAQRAITSPEVDQVVADPDVTFTDRAGNPCYVRTIAGRRIKVVVASDDPGFVITVITLDPSGTSQ